MEHMNQNNLNDSRTLNLYEKQEKIYTRRMDGFFQRIQLFTGWPFLFAFFITPWLTIDNRQAVLFDLVETKFYIYWITFWPQDFILLSWSLIFAAFLLFFITNLIGRVWCGYTCPQTIWTAIFTWAEQLAEGNRNQRIKLDKSNLTFNKILKKTTKHSMWICFALFTSITFVSYFYGLYEMSYDAWNLNLSSPVVFWLVFFTLATYFNAGWMREQLCKYICPYARFQSSMFDEDTLIVSYDECRGEIRGPRKKNLKPKGLGDCVDCSVCVQVCPVGIDIRDGLQYECTNCARCIDACNSVMNKMDYKKGLISYTTLSQLKGKSFTWKRPKLVGYGLAVITMLISISVLLISRPLVHLDILRDRNLLYQEVSGGYIQNSYKLNILNMSEHDNYFTLKITGLKKISIVPESEIFIQAGTAKNVAINVITDPDQLNNLITKILISATSTDNKLVAEAESRFIGPSSIQEI